MNRRTFLKIAAASGAGIFNSCTNAAGQRDYPNIILVVLDTLRADFLDLRDTSPNALSPVLAQLAQGAYVFQNAWSTHDWTVPSHFSLFTGFHDGRVGPFDHQANTLTHYLKAMGFIPVGVAANGTLVRNNSSFLKDFQHYTNIVDFQAPKAREQFGEIRKRTLPFNVPITDLVGIKILQDATGVMDRMEFQLDQAEPGPYFMFLNFMDVHDPYLPPIEFYDVNQEPPVFGFHADVRERHSKPLEEVARDGQHLTELQTKLKHTLGKRWSLTVDLPETHLDLYRSRYRACIRYLDHRMDRLINILKTRDLFENSIIIITSDHGESFGEDGFITHGFSDQGDPLSTRKVPLIVIPQDKTLKSPIVIDEKVSIADIPLTLMDILGVGGLDDLEQQGFTGQHGKSFKTTLASHIDSYETTREYILSVNTEKEITDLSKHNLGAFAERIRALGYLQ